MIKFRGCNFTYKKSITFITNKQSLKYEIKIKPSIWRKSNEFVYIWVFGRAIPLDFIKVSFSIKILPKLIKFRKIIKDRIFHLGYI